MMGVMAVGLGAAAFAPVPDRPSGTAQGSPQDAASRVSPANATPVPPGIGGAALR
jgi:hypothetical protein